MRLGSFHRWVVIVIAIFVVAPALSAQVPEAWTALIAAPKCDGLLSAMTVFDDGTGPALYAAGSVEGENAGGGVSRVVVRFDGSAWRGLACPFEGHATALLVKDLGNGPALFVAGAFRPLGTTTNAHGVLRYDGTTWSALPGVFNNEIRALASFSSTDPSVYVGGFFTAIDGVATAAVARWDGTQWNTLGSGIGPSLPPNLVGYGVNVLVSHDDGTGRKLYAGGNFLTAGGQSVNRIAAWNGTQWSGVGGGVTGGIVGTVQAMASDESGPTHVLYVGGGFQAAGGVTVNQIARWSNGQWSALGTGVTASAAPLNTISYVSALTIHDDGTGAKLYAGGRIGVIGGATVRNLARWNGTSWSSVAGGVARSTEFSGQVNAFAPIPGSMNLAVGGDFDNVGTANLTATGVAAFGAGAWSAIGGGILVDREESLVASAYGESLDIVRTSTGDQLVARGDFRSIDGISARGIATFDGAQWTRLDEGLPFPPRSITSHDDGSGPSLYAFADGLYRRTGSIWVRIDTALPGAMDVQHIFSFDAGLGRQLYAIEGSGVLRISRWTGTGWTIVTTLAIGSYQKITTLRVLDLATGPTVAFGGDTPQDDGSDPAFVAQWSGGTINGYQWMGYLSCGPNGFPCALYGSCADMCTFDFGSGNEIVACGTLFTTPGIVVRRKTPTGWQNVGGPVTGPTAVAKRLVVTDDGRGRALTLFTDDPTQGLERHRFVGGAWVTESVGLDVTIPTVTTFDDGGGEDLVVWGRFRPANLPSTRTIAFAHSCLDAGVGQNIGRPEPSLAIGPIGLPTTARSIDLALGQALTLEVRQPTTTAFPANFFLVGLFGVPDSSTAVTSPFGFTAMPLPGGSAPTFWLTSNFGGFPGLLPSTPAPWTRNLPGLPYPAEFTVQGAILDSSATFGLAPTNGIVVRIGM